MFALKVLAGLVLGVDDPLLSVAATDAVGNDVASIGPGPTLGLNSLRKDTTASIIGVSFPAVLSVLRPDLPSSSNNLQNGGV